MSSLVVAMDNPQLNEHLRTYSLYKSEQFFGYGIAFHTEDIAISEPYHKLVYPLIEIEPQSPAEEAGMRNGQRVVAVNGEFVNKEFKTLEDVVQAIEDSYLQYLQQQYAKESHLKAVKKFQIMHALKRIQRFWKVKYAQIKLKCCILIQKNARRFLKWLRER